MLNKTTRPEEILTFFNTEEEILEYLQGENPNSFQDGPATLPLEGKVQLKVSKLIILNHKNKTPAGRLFYKAYRFESTIVDTVDSRLFRVFDDYTVIVLYGTTFITRNYEGISKDLSSLKLESSNLILLEDHLEIREDLKKQGIQTFVPKEIRKTSCASKINQWINIHQN